MYLQTGSQEKFLLNLSVDSRQIFLQSQYFLAYLNSSDIQNSVER
jgi:hypothetical protein